MLCTNEWKLVPHYHAREMDELYDLKNDPDELRNLYKNVQYREVRQQLQQRLDERMKAIHDPIAESVRLIVFWWLCSSRSPSTASRRLH